MPEYLLTAPKVSTWYMSDTDLTTNNVAYPFKTVILVKSNIDYIIDFQISENLCFVIKNETSQSILFAKNENADTFWNLGPNTMHLLSKKTYWDATKLPNVNLEQAANYAELAQY